MLPRMIRFSIATLILHVLHFQMQLQWHLPRVHLTAAAAAVPEEKRVQNDHKLLPCAKTVWQLKKILRINEAKPSLSCEGLCSNERASYWFGEIEQTPDVCIAVLPPDCSWDLAFHAADQVTLEDGLPERKSTFHQNSATEDPTAHIKQDSSLTCECRFFMTAMRRLSVPESDTTLHDARSKEQSQNSDVSAPSADKRSAAFIVLQVCQLNKLTSRLQINGWSAAALANERVAAKEHEALYCRICDDRSSLEAIHTIKYPGLPRDNDEGAVGDESYSIAQTLPYLVLTALISFFALVADELAPMRWPRRRPRLI